MTEFHTEYSCWMNVSMKESNEIYSLQNRTNPQHNIRRQVTSTQNLGSEDIALNPSSSIHIPWGLGKIFWPLIHQIMIILIITHKYSLIIKWDKLDINIRANHVNDKVV